MKRKYTKKPVADRFISMVDKSEACWNWTGYTTQKGYGQFSMGGGPKYSHRVSFELFKGPVNNELFVCHTCDNPRCVRPSHLFLGTAKDNSNDMIKKGRDHKALGEKSSNSKLSAKEVQQIRKMRSGGVCTKILSKRFSTSRSNIYSILRGVTWRHI